MAENQTWLTQEAHDRLVGELEQLTGPGRREISARIEAAREEGDLKENGGYHAAKDEQGKMEARIRDLEELLKHAVVGEAPVSRGIVEIGTVITAEVWGTKSASSWAIASWPTATSMSTAPRARWGRRSWG